MNVLFGCAQTLNPVVQRLCQALGEHPGIEAARRDLEVFWAGSSEVDLLHLHWPRALFESWRNPTQADVDKLERRLEQWGRHVPIVATIHNVRPHYRSENPVFEALYRCVFRAVDGFVHMGATSQELLHVQYDCGEKEEVVIPHGNYDGLPNAVNRQQARQELGIGEQTSLALVFGAVRDPEELALILNGTEHWDRADRQTLVAGRLGWTNGEILPYIVRWYHQLRALPRPVRFRFGEFPDASIQYFLNASDVVLIPRKKVLNSGNVALGFTFGRVVVGPDVGVVGEVLRDTGNPVFDPSSPASIGSALERGMKMRAAGKGDENAQYARTKLNWKNIADQHVDFYRHVLQLH